MVRANRAFSPLHCEELPLACSAPRAPHWRIRGGRRRASGATKVKVAVSDIDGDLRGKHRTSTKFLGAAEPYPAAASGFCDVVLG